MAAPATPQPAPPKGACCRLLCGLLGLALAGCGGKPDEANFPPGAAAATPPAASTASKPQQMEATKERPFVNGLGMRFVPLPKSRVLFSVWETRVQDFAAFLKATGRPVPEYPSAKNSHPVSGVSWNDAAAFCAWLTEFERKAGRIGPDDRYRLPRDREWSVAVGETRYPWGDDWPKAEARDRLPGHRPGASDHTAPVGGHPANALGIHDLGGNVFEWCLDWYSLDMNPPELRLEFERLTFDGKGTTFKVLRGASWVFFDSLNLLSGYRYFNLPDARGILYGFRPVLERDALGQGQPPPANLPPWRPPLADARSIAGRETYRNNCVECHQYYDPVLYPQEDWNRWLDRMRGKAKLNDKAFAEVTHFTRQLRDTSGGATGGGAMAVR